MEISIPVLTIAGTLLLVITGLLNYSVFVRQLRASRQQLETAQRQLENARQQPEILLVQRAMDETSDHLKILVDKPYLRPYFYDNKEWKHGDPATPDELKSMAELLLNNFASAVIHSAAFPQYPVRSVEQTIRFHLRRSPAMREFLLDGFERFQLAGIALLLLKNDTKEQTIADLTKLMSADGIDDHERDRRKSLLQYLKSTDQVDPVQLARYTLRAPQQHAT
jgi:hypothetical protein